MTQPPHGANAGLIRAAQHASNSAVVPLLIGLGLIAIALIGAVVIITHRRRRDDSEARQLDHSVTRLLAAGRRFSASDDADEIIDLLVAETTVLTRSRAAAVVLVDYESGELTSVVESVPGLVQVRHLDRGRIHGVLEAATATRSVIDEPALSGGRQAVMVAPLVRAGSICGAVIACRDADTPYDQVTTDLLAELVPLAATALTAADRHEDVAILSYTDGLTELGNRRRLDRDLRSTLDGSNGSVGFVMIDIDHFKLFNDTYGHVAGDEVLQVVARLLRENVRESDVVYRYGGEEFSVLLPAADLAEVAQVAERVRQAVEAHDFAVAGAQPGSRITVSVGLTDATGADPRQAKECADRALYEAKRRGRNQVVVDEGVGAA